MIGDFPMFLAKCLIFADFLQAGHDIYRYFIVQTAFLLTDASVAGKTR